MFSIRNKSWSSILFRGYIILLGLATVSGGAIADIFAQESFNEAPYTHKARNWQPADYGLDAGSWEEALRICHERLESDPEDLEALLLRAVAYREFGVRRALLLRVRDWKRSEADFRSLFERDSTYQDLHYQYAHLQRYKGEYEHALRLMHAQVDMRPELSYTIPALLRLYREFLLNRKQDEVEAWFDANPSGYVSLFRAEMLMKARQWEEADTILSELLLARRGLPYQPILLARARIYYALNRPDIAQSYVMQAIEAIDGPVPGRLVGEDFKYILTDREVSIYLGLKTAPAFKDFFHRIWEERNPARSEAINRRLQAHYLRLIQAERQLAYYSSREAYRIMNNVRMDRMADRDFPYAYWLNGELGDKGLVLVRHGPPHTTANSVNEDTPYIESWRYVNPDMDFHFEGLGSLGELIPTLPLDLNTVEAREIWGGSYAQLTRAIRQRDGVLGYDPSEMNQMDLMVFNNDIFDQSLKDARVGLTSDRHRWGRALRHLDVPHVLAAFRGSEENTRVEVYYAVPIGKVVPELEQVAEQVEIRVGMSMHDSTWQPAFKSYESFDVPPTVDPAIAAIDFFSFEVPPDSYHVNVHAQVEESEWLGSYQFEYRVRDLTGDELLVSDILPASNVEPTDRSSRYVKNGLLIQSNPSSVYHVETPLFVYFEVYNLNFGNDDLTHYTITYSLKREESERPRLKIFRRGDEPALSITYERDGAGRTAIEYGEIDMSAVPAGGYDLKVIVTDQTTGATAEAGRRIVLEDG